MMKLLKFVAEAIRISPYSVYYTLLYPILAKKPSFKQHTKMPLSPLFAGADPLNCYKLVFFGDLLPIDDIPQIAAPLQAIFKSADLIVGNLEAPLLYSSLAEWRSNKEANFWCKSISEEFLLAVLENMCVPKSNLILSVANNHSQDWGDDGLSTTIEFLDKNNIKFVGEYKAVSPLFKTIELAGLRVGLLAWTNWLNHSREFADPEHSGVVRQHHLKLLDDGLNYDLLIAFPHWDYEYQHVPCKETVKLAHELSAKGFSIIAGSHTHTVQPLQKINNSYCLYSLGNFFNPGHALSSAPSSDLGIIWEVYVNKSSKTVTGYNVVPFVHERAGNQLTLLNVEEDNHYTQILKRVYQL